MGDRCLLPLPLSRITRSAPSIQESPVTSAITEPVPGTRLPKHSKSVKGVSKACTHMGWVQWPNIADARERDDLSVVGSFSLNNASVPITASFLMSPTIPHLHVLSSKCIPMWFADIKAVKPRGRLSKPSVAIYVVC